MRGTITVTAALKRTALAVALCAGTVTAASAAVLPFTWDPSAAGVSTSGAFTANDFITSDYASISLPSNPSVPGSISESGFLLVQSFNLNGSPASTVNTTGAAGWGMYEAFTATSHLSPCTGGLCGAFDSISVTTFAYSTINGLASVSFNAAHTPVITLPTANKRVTLATGGGPIAVSPNTVSIIHGVPTASVDASFIPEVSASAFFVSPTSGISLDLDQAFINTIGVISTFPAKCGASRALPCLFEIHGGGGNGDFLVVSKVPEPASLLVLGAGLGAVGFVKRRRA